MRDHIHIGLIFFAAYILSFLLCGCSIAPPNVPVCIETNIDSARCTTLISGENFRVDETHLLEGKTYFQIRPQMILVPASSWVEIKKFVIDICAQTHQCSNNVGSWQTTLNTLQSDLDEKVMP